MRSLLKSLACVAMILGFAASCLASESSAVNTARAFFTWLETHKKEFANCNISKAGAVYKLCDGTEVNQKYLAKLFQLAPADLVKELRQLGIKVEILCDSNPQASKTFAENCQLSSTRKMFKELSALHGQYLPEEKMILIRSSALKGSLVHEYVHFLQSESKNSIYGKVYKQEKNSVKKTLTAEMDRLILKAQELEKQNDKAELKILLKDFT